jgi:hypothetical protein
MSLFNRVLEIKFSIFISTLAGIAILSSLITFTVMNSAKQQCLPCQSIESPLRTQPKKFNTREPGLYLVPSDNGRKF